MSLSESERAVLWDQIEALLSKMQTAVDQVVWVWVWVRVWMCARTHAHARGGRTLHIRSGSLCSAVVFSLQSPVFCLENK
jgi:hypothetical protein